MAASASEWRGVAAFPAGACPSQASGGTSGGARERGTQAQRSPSASPTAPATVRGMLPRAISDPPPVDSEGVDTDSYAPEATPRSSSFNPPPTPRPRRTCPRLRSPPTERNSQDRDLVRGGSGSLCGTPTAEGAEMPVHFSSPPDMTEEQINNRTKLMLKKEKTISATLQNALDVAHEKIRELNGTLKKIKAQLHQTRLRECSECLSRAGRGEKRQRDTEGTPVGDKTPKRKKKKGSIAERISNHIRRIDEDKELDGQLQSASRAALSKDNVFLCNDVVSQVTTRPLRSTVHTREVSQHLWLPRMVAISEGNGTPVFCMEVAGDVDAVGVSPKHPLELARRGMLEGGMVATPALEVTSLDEDSWKLHAIRFIRVCMEYQDAVPGSSEDPDVASKLHAYATIIANSEGVVKYVRDMHSKRLSTVKNEVNSALAKVLGFGSIAKFQTFFSSKTIPSEEKSEVVNILGMGGDAQLAHFPRNFSEWSARPSASLSAWRTMKQDVLDRVRVLAENFHASHSDAHEQTKARAEITAIKDLHVQGADIFFGTAQMRQLFTTFSGRSLVVVVDGGDSPHPYQEIEGDTSVITLARLDAHVSTWLCALVRGAELDKRHPSHFGAITEFLLPPAVDGILKTCRKVLQNDSSCSTELCLPFKFSSAVKALATENLDMGDVADLDRTGAPYKAVCTVLDNEMSSHDTLMHSSAHHLDYYRASSRPNTIHFFDAEDKKSYCVLKAAFVKSRICSWIGDVHDVFVGIADDEDVKFRDVTGYDAFVVNMPRRDESPKDCAANGE